MSQARVVSTPNFNKLKGMEDYSNWKFAMKILLMREKLWSYGTGEAYGADKTPDAEKAWRH